MIMVHFSKPVSEIIKMRSSWRSFSEKPIEKEKLEKLEELASSLTRGPFGNQARFILIDSNKKNVDSSKRLGTYGIVRGARFFLTGAVQKAVNCYVDLGFLFEQLVLLATDLGLGTVWLGVTFRKTAFSEALASTNGSLTTPKMKCWAKRMTKSQSSRALSDISKSPAISKHPLATTKPGVPTQLPYKQLEEISPYISLLKTGGTRLVPDSDLRK